jgi:ribosomal protein S18 acetylase RimI-like enzyme
MVILFLKWISDYALHPGFAKRYNFGMASWTVEVKTQTQLIETVRVEDQDWDSSILQMKVARIVDFIEHAKHDRVSYAALVKDFTAKDLSYVVVRRPQGEWSRVHSLECAGFRLVDGIVQFRAQLAPEDKQLSCQLDIAQQSEADELGKIAAETFTVSRFHNDPLLSKSIASQIHIEWMRNSVLGRNQATALIARDPNGEIAGFVTCKVKSDVGTIELIGVAKPFVGQGFGKRLVRESSIWFAKRGCNFVEVQTQTNNFTAQNLYAKQGFAAVASHLTLRWARTDEPV